MELSERHIQSLETAGYSNISEEQFPAHHAWNNSTTDTSVVMLVTDGLVKVTISDHTETVVLGNRFTVPPHTSYQALAGPDGVIYITGEL